jgi:hypothetical protein
MAPGHRRRLHWRWRWRLRSRLRSRSRRSCETRDAAADDRDRRAAVEEAQRAEGVHEVERVHLLGEQGDAPLEAAAFLLRLGASAAVRKLPSPAPPLFSRKMWPSCPERASSAPPDRVFSRQISLPAVSEASRPRRKHSRGPLNASRPPRRRSALTRSAPGRRRRGLQVDGAWGDALRVGGLRLARPRRIR